MITCAVDHSEFANREDLHKHIRWALKIKLEDYYTKYHARNDLYDGSPIVFKDVDSYLHSYFNSRENLVAYFKRNPKDVQTFACCIAARAEQKGLVWAPSTVECRTSILPTPLLAERLGFDYNGICDKAGLKTKYNYYENLHIAEKGELEILVDSREQHALPLSGKLVQTKLDFGDYACRSHYTNTFIERKSLIDLCGSLSVGFERLNKEFTRAKDMDANIVVCVESKLGELAHIRANPETKHVKSTPDFLGVRLREICQKFPKTQFLFVNGRFEMVRIIEKLFRLSNNIGSLDAQYLYDSGKL